MMVVILVRNGSAGRPCRATAPGARVSGADAAASGSCCTAAGPGARRAVENFKAAVDRHISEEGRALLARIANQCVADASLSLGFTSSERFIKNNGTFADVLAQEPDTVATLDR